MQSSDTLHQFGCQGLNTMDRATEEDTARIPGYSDRHELLFDEHGDVQICGRPNGRYNET